ncbi:hypothetical protein [Georgenia sp. MJ170]|uniref:phage tail tube protein n=1 Tax=Georgenia sunbinii TaxID=3117728 RepID=UPI002F269C67
MLDPDNARIYGGDLDGVAIGALGIAGPEDLDDLEEPWEYAGWLNDNGLDFNPSDSVQRLRGHQGGAVVRTKMSESDTAFVFRALETKLLTHGLQFDVKERTTVGGVTRMRLGSGRKVEARAFVIDLHDEGVHRRFYIPRGEIGERAALAFRNSEITTYELTVQIIGDWWEITNDPALADPSDGGGGV